eukprot:scaffold122691_cov18-Tisochrysis_lutea.AAC.1
MHKALIISALTAMCSTYGCNLSNTWKSMVALGDVLVKNGANLTAINRIVMRRIVMWRSMPTFELRARRKEANPGQLLNYVPGGKQANSSRIPTMGLEANRPKDDEKAREGLLTLPTRSTWTALTSPLSCPAPTMLQQL